MNITKFQKKLNKCQAAYGKAELDLSSLAIEIQPFFTEEISVTPSTDGAMITNNDGEIETVQLFIDKFKRGVID